MIAHEFYLKCALLLCVSYCLSQEIVQKENLRLCEAGVHSVAYSNVEIRFVGSSDILVLEVCNTGRYLNYNSLKPHASSCNVCPRETYNKGRNFCQECLPCTICEDNQIEITKCKPSQDRACADRSGTTLAPHNETRTADQPLPTTIAPLPTYTTEQLTTTLENPATFEVPEKTTITKGEDPSSKGPTVTMNLYACVTLFGSAIVIILALLVALILLSPKLRKERQGRTHVKADVQSDNRICEMRNL